MDFREDPLPLLVMPYLPFGNLEDLHSESPIAVEETIEICFQTLKALRYLHPRGVAHRDLEPENILVKSRSPLSIKLADFGLANNRPDLKTVCGTQRYAAPEVYLGSEYTASVDLWSQGVIILQYMYGLPKAPRQRRGQHKNSPAMLEEWGLAWCRRVVDDADDWDSDDMIDLLTAGMLRIAPEERLSASACLTKGCDLRLFDGHSLDSGSDTPARQTAAAAQGKVSDDDASTTILLGTLWDTERESSNDEGNGRPKRRPPNHTSGVLESSNSRATNSPSNGGGRGSQFGSFGTDSEHGGSNVQPPVSHSCLREAGSKYLGGYKRRRPTALGSANKSSSRERIKRRLPEDRVTQIPIPCAHIVSDQCLGHRGKSDQLYTI